MAGLVMATSSGEEHGLINTLTNRVKWNDCKHMAPKDKEEILKQKKDDAKIVKAEYLNSRGRHERLTKAYCRYAGEPIQIWHFIPGKVYEVPLGLVREVNDKNKILKRRSGLVSEDGSPLKKDESPIESDMDGSWLHKFVASGVLE